MLTLYESRASSGLLVKDICAFFNMSRQALHKYRDLAGQQQQMLDQIKSEVLAYRRFTDHRAGSRNLYYNLFIKEKYNIGITKFEGLLSTNKLCLPYLKTRIITTNSTNLSKRYDNLTNGFELSGINQVVAGDITYYHHHGELYYIFTLLDIYSAMIVGIHASKRMRTTEAVEVLNQWIQLRGEVNIEGCIHHTDGGGQYFSHNYINRTAELKIRMSVAKNCLENGYAEQRNGFLKHHLLPLLRNIKGDYLNEELTKAVYQYNYKRKQEKLGWCSPVEFEEKMASKQKESISKQMHNFSAHIGFARHIADRINTEKKDPPKKD